MSKEVIMGINYGSGHDSAAALIVDGELIAMSEEERFTRKKHDASFPYQSIDFCLNKAGLTYAEVDYVAIGWDEWIHFQKRVSFLLNNSDLKNLVTRLKFLRALRIMARSGRQTVLRLFPKAKFIPVEHHIAHAASCFFISDFDESAIISWDGRGEWTTTLLAFGHNNEIKKIQEDFYPRSLGLLYTAVTHYLGFKSNDEYKVMGLSAYGEPTYIKEFEQVIKTSDNNFFDVNLTFLQHPGSSSKVNWGEPKYFSDKMIEVFGPARKKGDPVEKRHMDMAKSLQVCFSEVGIKIAQRFRMEVKTDNLCLAGGVALNGVMNNQILKKSGFKKLFFNSAPNDSGVALGAALYVYNQIIGNRKRINVIHPFWGYSATTQDIKKEIESYQYENVLELSDPAITAAKLIAKGYIIGWFQGRSEFGPRALGNRSILADPRPAKNKDIVNARIKFREEFRPFAPSVLIEHVKDYFDLPCESPYMLLICDVLHDKREKIQAVTHVDYTARPQTVSKEFNELYYNLIHHFHEITGCAVVLNTSFNVRGEPIVNTVADAIRCFYSTGLDFLIIGNYLLHKRFGGIRDIL
jgi:carbamoyltransferase